MSTRQYNPKKPNEMKIFLMARWARFMKVYRTDGPVYSRLTPLEFI